MSIGKIIKTGLAIYGGAVLAKKLGQYIFVKNKDKIAAKVKEKIVKACDKAIDEVFKKEPEDETINFKASLFSMPNADSAYNTRQAMIDLIHDESYGTVSDLILLTGTYFISPAGSKWGWTDPNEFEMAPIERLKKEDGTYEYYIDVGYPHRLEGK